MPSSKPEQDVSAGENFIHKIEDEINRINSFLNQKNSPNHVIVLNNLVDTIKRYINNLRNYYDFDVALKSQIESNLVLLERNCESLMRNYKKDLSQTVEIYQKSLNTEFWKSKLKQEEIQSSYAKIYEGLFFIFSNIHRILRSVTTEIGSFFKANPIGKTMIEYTTAMRNVADKGMYIHHSAHQPSSNEVMDLLKGINSAPALVQG